MSLEQPTQVDLDELTSRILAIRRGELPADAVTAEELRAAIQIQRERFKAGGEKAAAKKSSTPKKSSATIDFTFTGLSSPDSSSGTLF